MPHHNCYADDEDCSISLLAAAVLTAEDFETDDGRRRREHLQDQFDYLEIDGVRYTGPRGRAF